MGGNCVAAPARGRLSLARERVRVAQKAINLSELLTFILSPCRKGRGDKARKGSRDSGLMRQDEGPISCGRTLPEPLQIVYFSACKPGTAAVLRLPRPGVWPTTPFE